MSHLEHERAAATRPGRVAVVTLSDTRASANAHPRDSAARSDASGDAIESALRDGGFTLAWRALIPDDASALRAAVDRATDDPTIDALITTGGTGVSPRDVTIDTLRPMLDYELPGFGELFRMLSWQQVGAAALLSRATAGVRRRTLIAALPGSTPAVTLALRELLVPQLRHLTAQLAKHAGPGSPPPPTAAP